MFQQPNISLEHYDNHHCQRSEIKLFRQDGLLIANELLRLESKSDFFTRTNSFQGLSVMYFIPDAFLDSLLSEDIPYGDATAALLGLEKCQGNIYCFPKADTVVSGISLAARLFTRAGLTVKVLAKDGDFVVSKTPVLSASGSADTIHAVYKTAQNIMEYCSGISTRTRRMVEAVQATNPYCQVVTTRKHFPGTKLLSLYAVLAGGGLIHRIGLSESILIFDQHRVFASKDILDRIARIHRTDPERKITVEASTVSEALSFARAGANIVQCERFVCSDISTLKQKLLEHQLPTLISAAGGINVDNAEQYAAAGADFLVTSWPYFGRPMDIKMVITAQN